MAQILQCTDCFRPLACMHVLQIAARAKRMPRRAQSEAGYLDGLSRVHCAGMSSDQDDA